MKTFAKIFLLLIISISCSKKEKEWVAIGDSITYLNDHQEETGNRITKGYLTRVSDILPNLNFVNKGYNGWTAIQIADKISQLNLSKADVYSVFLGTNDWWHGNPIGTFDDYKRGTGNQTFFGAYRTITETLKKINPDAKIILITPMQRGDFVYIADMNNHAYGSYKAKAGQTLEQFADAVITISKEENFEALDLFHASELGLENMVKFKRLKDPQTGMYKNYPYPEYIDIPFNPASDEYPYPVEAIDATYDGLHPSDKGYEIIAQMLVKVFDK